MIWVLSSMACSLFSVRWSYRNSIACLTGIVLLHPQVYESLSTHGVWKCSSSWRVFRNCLQFILECFYAGWMCTWNLDVINTCSFACPVPNPAVTCVLQQSNSWPWTPAKLPDITDRRAGCTQLVPCGQKIKTRRYIPDEMPFLRLGKFV